MAPFIFAQLMVLAAGYAVWELLVVTRTARLAGVDWMRDSIAFIALCATAIPVLFLQYRRHRTIFSRWFAIGGIAVAAVAYISAPLTLALALETHFSKQPSLGSSMQIALGQHFEEQFWRPVLEPKVMLHIPISVEGIPAGTEMQPDALSISLQGADGRTAKLGAADCWDLKRGTISASEATISALCGRTPRSFTRCTIAAVTLRASLYFTLFGNARSQTIPLSDAAGQRAGWSAVLYQRGEGAVGCVLPVGFSLAGSPGVREAWPHQCQFLRAVRLLLAVPRQR